MGTVTTLGHPAAEHTRSEASGLPVQGSSSPRLLPLSQLQESGIQPSLSLRAERGLRGLTTLSAEEGLWNFKGRKCLFPAHNLFMCFLEKKQEIRNIHNHGSLCT